MKKKKIIIIGIILISLTLITILVTIFINNLNKDKKLTEENMSIINNSYENIKKEVENYNELRNNITIFINNFYYDTIEINYSNNLEILKKYDETINKITKEINVLEEKCNLTYNNENTKTICNQYKEYYEIIINVFINDINNYNNKLTSFNDDNNKKLELFKSKYINDYIDYNNDNKYMKKDEINE